jgi:hypothetical protein
MSTRATGTLEIKAWICGHEQRYPVTLDEDFA